MKIEKLNKRLNGYHRHFKGRFLLVKDGLLTPFEFILWDLSWSVLADWDKEHTDTFGSFKLTQEEIGHYLGVSKSTVSRATKKLIKVGLWVKLPDKYIRVTAFEMNAFYGGLTKKVKCVDLQKYILVKQPEYLTKQQLFALSKPLSPKEKQKIQGYTVAKSQQDKSKDALGSYKGNLGSLDNKYEYGDIEDEFDISEEDIEAMESEHKEIDPNDLPF